ncbi:MAG: DNA primase DnaG [Conexivisphaerales archaeon]
MTDSSIVKYLIKLKFTIDGVVEKADVVGAIFGQTEGLFGPELDLNELQKNWKIGRIEINLQSKNAKTNGEVIIPASTDISTAALIAAAIESVDKVGPCAAKFELVDIEDVRASKRKLIEERAKGILKEWSSKAASEGEEVVKSVSESIKPGRVLSYGPEKLPAGPGIHDSDEVILVEGRADVINLMRAGINNTLAIGGAKVPESVVKLSKQKRTIAFLDGDRSGDLISKELQQVANVQMILRAPPGKEVEDLTPVEVLEILKKREVHEPQRIPQHTVQRGQQKSVVKIDSKIEEKIKDIYPTLKDTLEACIYDDNLKELGRIPVSELASSLEGFKGAKHIIFDGIVTQRLIDLASRNGVSTLVGFKVADNITIPNGLTVTTFWSLGLN